MQTSDSRWFTATPQLSPSTPSVAYCRLTRGIPVYLSRKNARFRGAKRYTPSRATKAKEPAPTSFSTPALP